MENFTFAYQKVTYNDVDGYVATCCINRVFFGKYFAKTKKLGREKAIASRDNFLFEQEEERAAMEAFATWTESI